MSNFPIAINPYRRPIVIKTDIIAKIIAGMLFLVEKKVPIFNIRNDKICSRTIVTGESRPGNL